MIISWYDAKYSRYTSKVISNKFKTFIGPPVTVRDENSFIMVIEHACQVTWKPPHTVSEITQKGIVSFLNLTRMKLCTCLEKVV